MDMLWDFPPQRFIPHETGLEKPPHPNLVRIYHELPEDSHFVIINLTAKPVAMAGKFEKIFEVVMPNEQQATSSRVSHYSQLKCDIKTIPVNLGNRSQRT